MKAKKTSFFLLVALILSINLGSVFKSKNSLANLSLKDFIKEAIAAGEDCWEHPEDTGWAMFTNPCPPNSIRHYYDRCEPCFDPDDQCNVADQTTCMDLF